MIDFPIFTVYAAIVMSCLSFQTFQWHWIHIQNLATYSASSSGLILDLAVSRPRPNITELLNPAVLTSGRLSKPYPNLFCNLTSYVCNRIRKERPESVAHWMIIILLGKWKIRLDVSISTTWKSVQLKRQSCVLSISMDLQFHLNSAHCRGSVALYLSR